MTMRIETRVVVWRDDGPHISNNSHLVEDVRGEPQLVALLAMQVGSIVIEATAGLIEHECELPADKRNQLVGLNDRRN